jgi:flagellar operon protein
MNQIRNSYASIEQIQNQYLPQNSKAVSSSSDQITSFQDVLRNQLNEANQVPSVKFSKHAAQRLDERDILLSAEQSERLNAGVQAASEKGINDSLVIVDSLAFIVNVPSHTVVTAMDQDDSTAINIYTNIDGAVIV